jgi:ABC-type transporter Mla subunit MlaD
MKGGTMPDNEETVENVVIAQMTAAFLRDLAIQEINETLERLAKARARLEENKDTLSSETYKEIVASFDKAQRELNALMSKATSQ